MVGAAERAPVVVAPIKMMFVKENEAWKVYAIRNPAAGPQPDAASSGAPGRAEQVALAFGLVRSPMKRDPR